MVLPGGQIPTYIIKSTHHRREDAVTGRERQCVKQTRRWTSLM